MAENDVGLSPDDFFGVFSNVRRDIFANQQKTEAPSDLSLSQSELDELFAKRQEEKQKKEDSLSPEYKEKLAASRARSAELVKQINAKTRRRLVVVFGSAERNNNELQEINIGDKIELKRQQNELVSIFLDGKLYARGEAVTENGRRSVIVKEFVAR